VGCEAGLVLGGGVGGGGGGGRERGGEKGENGQIEGEKSEGRGV